MRDLIETVIKLGTKRDPNSPAMRFIDSVEGATDEHPFDHRSRLHGEVSITIYPSVNDRNNRVRISDIQSLAPGMGRASETLKALCDEADEMGVDLELTAKAYGRQHLTTQQLVAWYERYGFVPESYGEPIDEPDYDDGVDMIRRHGNSISLGESAPPGEKAQHFIHDRKAEFKKRYGKRWKTVLYATAWKEFGPHHHAKD